MVEEAVAAAKAVKTTKEYYNVIDKYLGSLYNGAVKSVTRKATTIYPSPSDYGWVVIVDKAVYISENTIGELNKLVNMTKDIEVQIKAAEKVQAALGEYNYKDIAKDMWDEAETYRLGLAYFIENGDAKKMPANLKAEIENLTATSKASEINAAVDKALAIYTVYTRLAQYKLAAMDIVNGFAGYEYDWTKASENSDYYGTDTLAQMKSVSTSRMVCLPPLSNANPSGSLAGSQAPRGSARRSSSDRSVLRLAYTSAPSSGSSPSTVKPPLHFLR